MVKPAVGDNAELNIQLEEKTDAKVNCFDSNFGCFDGFELREHSNVIRIDKWIY